MDFYNLIKNNYPFSLDDFQEGALKALIHEKDVLITAHTGSGKTLIGEFGIRLSLLKGKRAIFTSPIKSLSNQKYHDFRKIFPRVGIITGDVQFQSDAPLLIMTTEILRNYLIRLGLESSDKDKPYILADLNLSDVGCIVFDEVHYINNKDRGHVWETCLMKIPSDIQCVLLSATLDNPSKLTIWFQKNHHKEIVIFNTDKRVVPLEFYFYDRNKFFELNSENMLSLKTDTKKYKKERHKNKNFNEILRDLKKKDLLPALFFVLSKKRLEKQAKLITECVISDKSDKSDKSEEHKYNISKEIRSLLSKIPKEIREGLLKIDQYHEVIRLLNLGIGIHHAGLHPILKEIVEILYGKSLIRVLLATETFAVGINMPTRTVIFTDIKKFDGKSDFRYFNHAEFIQMSGRAGRRGIDTKGTIILHGDFIEPDPELLKLLHGKQTCLESKFQLSYELIMGWISENPTFDYLLEQSHKSLLSEEHEKYYHGIKLSPPTDIISYLKNETIIKFKEKYINWIDSTKNKTLSANKRRKEWAKISDKDRKTIEEIKQKEIILKKYEMDLSYYKTLIEMNLKKYLYALIDFKWIDFNEDDKKFDILPEGQFGMVLGDISHPIWIQKVLKNYVFHCPFEAVFLMTVLAVRNSNKIVNMSDIYDNIKEKTVDGDLLTELKYKKTFNILGDFSKEIESINHYVEKVQLHHEIEFKEEFHFSESNLYVGYLAYQWAKNNIWPNDIYPGDWVKLMIKIGKWSTILSNGLKVSNRTEEAFIINQIEGLILKDQVSTYSLYFE